MHTIVIICSIPFIIRIIMYIYNIVLVKCYIAKKNKIKEVKQTKILVLIPVLREQRVICDTINHFINMKVENTKLYLIIAGTQREEKSDKETTLEVVKSWLDSSKQNLPDNIDVDYCEATDDGGDRATQLNYAVRFIKEIKGVNDLDYIGVYDADSLPSCDTINEVISSFCCEDNLSACQQPVHFIKAANKMSQNNENSILIANAIYQSTWTVISELPMWIKYYKKKNEQVSRRHIYLIGHGEFITNDIYENFHFPEYEVTDGIQLGYRLGMSNKKVKPLKEFCNDDVPHELRSLIMQHKRWFGGCMNLFSSYKWAKNIYGTNSIFQVFDGLWSQMRWAWTSITYIVLLVLSYITDKRLFTLYVVMGIVYCYFIPIISHFVLKDKIKVRIIDWLSLPLAILIKSVGPNIYLFSKLFRKKVKYEKVER